MVAFTTDVYNAYAKVLKDPSIMCLYLICVAQMIEVEKGEADTIFDHLEDILRNIISDPPNEFSKSIAGALQWIMKILITNQKFLLPQVFVWVPYFVKETSSNFNFTVILSIATMVFSGWSTVQTFIYGQLWYVYSELEDNSNRLVICIFAVMSVIFEPFSLNNGGTFHELVKRGLVSLPSPSKLFNRTISTAS